ncbi:hypothetical protein B0T17DRAFT_498944, partial [Bombardia bombarda]
SDFLTFFNNLLIKYLNDFYNTYLNNIFIFLNSFIKYKIYIRKVFEKLKDAGL